MSNRLSEIQSYLAMAPDDPFARYGLAMEYKSLGRLAEAQQCFDELLQRHPDYVPQYLMYGTLLIETRQREQARVVLQQGVLAARRARNQHALNELQAALNSLDEPPEEED